MKIAALPQPVVSPPPPKPAAIVPSTSAPKPGATAAVPSPDSSTTERKPAPAAPKTKRVTPKKPRVAKPTALTPDAKINLNCTLERRDAINATAAALGLTTTAYVLYCEEKAVHQLVQHFTNYIETRVLMQQEQVITRLLAIEQKLQLPTA